MKKSAFNLVDEVYDEGHYLLVKKGSTEEMIDYKNIKNINYNVGGNPDVVTLSLRNPCQFGDEVSFAPQSGWVPFRKNKDIIELIDKVDKLKNG